MSGITLPSAVFTMAWRLHAFPCFHVFLIGSGLFLRSCKGFATRSGEQSGSDCRGVVWQRGQKLENGFILLKSIGGTTTVGHRWDKSKKKNQQKTLDFAEIAEIAEVQVEVLMGPSPPQGGVVPFPYEMGNKS